jgi:HemY protein
MELEAGYPDEARALAAEAHKLAPDLVPAATVAARLFARHGDIRRASRILEATWKLAPHPEIAEAYADARPGDSARDRLKRVRRLTELRANHPEGAMAIARTAIDAHDWQAARNALGGAMRANPSERVCLLMAEIEEGENGDQGRVRAWLTRALSAPRDPSWTADGHIFDRWAPVSPVSGRIDAFEWRVAVDRLPALALRDVEVADAIDDEAEMNAAAAAERPPLASPPALVGPVGGETRSPRPAVPGSAPAGGPRPMARAPDDPGPPRRDEDEETSGLSVFRPGRTA